MVMDLIILPSNYENRVSVQKRSYGSEYGRYLMNGLYKHK